MPAVVAISEARANLPDLVEQVSGSRDHVTITKNGKPQALLVSYTELAAMQAQIDSLKEELESAIETAEILTINPNILAELKQSQEELDRGEYVRFEDLK